VRLVACVSWGNWSLQPYDMWEISDALKLHRDFHEDDTPELYVGAIDPLKVLPLESGSAWKRARRSTWDFLKKWGRIQRFAENDSYKMLKKVDCHSELITLLRRHTILEDLSQPISYHNETRTIAGSMQFLMNEVADANPTRQNPVAASKLLHVTIPKLFTMFDNPMCNKFFRTRASVVVYCGLLLPLTQSQIKVLDRENIRPNQEKVCHDSWPKLVDEINWTWARRKSA